MDSGARVLEKYDNDDKSDNEELRMWLRMIGKLWGQEGYNLYVQERDRVVWEKKGVVDYLISCRHVSLYKLALSTHSPCSYSSSKSSCHRLMATTLLQTVSRSHPSGILWIDLSFYMQSRVSGSNGKYFSIFMKITKVPFADNINCIILCMWELFKAFQIFKYC